jgi:hypothetical protein
MSGRHVDLLALERPSFAFIFLSKLHHRHHNKVKHKDIEVLA